MAFDFDRRSRRSIRLKDFDYSSLGKYYITICTLNRECLLGDIHDGKMIMSASGDIVRREWLLTQVVRTEIELDAFVIMPNHLHGIISICSCRGDPQHKSSTDLGGLDLSLPVGADRPNKNIEQIQASQRGAPTLKPRTIGSIVGQFKSNSTKGIRGSACAGFYWQRNYYEHIIRNESEFRQIRKYILENPANWNVDQDNPLNF
jgi:putative transposase